MQQQLALLLSLVGPIGCALIGGGWALHRWQQSGTLLWLLIPVAVVLFGLWWHRRWRRRFAARILTRITERLDP